nr:rhodanese-like domain-containing protein [uncultured Flavobacterium sp.]
MFGIFKNMFAQENNSQLSEAIQNGAFLVDVRTPAEFSGGSAKGAVNISLDKMGSHLEKLKGKKSILVFCKSGMRSAQAKSILEQNGFHNVINGGTWTNVQSVINSNK